MHLGLPTVSFQTNTNSQKPFRYRSFAEYHKHYVLRKRLLRRQRSLLRRQFLASFPASLLPRTRSPKSCLPERNLINTKYLFEEVLGTPPSYTLRFEKYGIGEAEEELEAEDLEEEMWFKMPESIFYLGTEDVAPLFLSAQSRNHIYPEEELACEESIPVINGASAKTREKGSIRTDISNYAEERSNGCRGSSVYIRIGDIVLPTVR
ncbi:hypothetical protein RUND412_003223 [Rhizina undulata]